METVGTTTPNTAVWRTQVHGTCTKLVVLMLDSERLASVDAAAGESATTSLVSNVLRVPVQVGAGPRARRDEMEPESRVRDPAPRPGDVLVVVVHGSLDLGTRECPRVP